MRRIAFQNVLMVNGSLSSTRIKQKPVSAPTVTKLGLTVKHVITRLAQNQEMAFTFKSLEKLLVSSHVAWPFLVALPALLTEQHATLAKETDS